MTDHRIPPYIRWLFFGGIGLVILVNLTTQAVIFLLARRYEPLEVHYTPQTHNVFLALFAVGLFALIVGARRYAEWDARVNAPEIVVLSIIAVVVSTLSLLSIPKIPNFIFSDTKTKEVLRDGRVQYLFEYSIVHHPHDYRNSNGNYSFGYSYEFILYECDDLHLFCVVKESSEPLDQF